MKYIERLALALFLIGPWCGCSTTHAASSAVESQRADDKLLHESERLEEHKAQGPSLVLEFAPIGADAPGVTPDTGAQAPRALPPHGDLIKATFIGATTDDLVAIAKMQAKEHETEATKATTATTSTMKPAAGCMLGLGFWGAITLVVVVVVLVGVLKLKARAASKAASAAKALLP